MTTIKHIHSIARELLKAINKKVIAAFIVNILAMIITMLILYKTARKMGVSEVISLLAVLSYGVSGACIDQVTTLRAYMLASIFQVLLFTLHLNLFDAAQKDKKMQFTNSCVWLLFVYVIGYVTHYTILFWAAFLGLNTVIWFVKNISADKVRYVWHYIASGVSAICIGFIIDPVSIMGLL